MSNSATRYCPECGSPHPIDAVRCANGHALPRPETETGNVLGPEAAIPGVGDAPDANLASDLFAFDGRIGRQKFWLMGIVIYLMWVAFSVLTRFVSAVVSSSGDPQSAIGVGTLLFWGSAIAGFWMWLAVYAKRWHDRGKSGWWSLILLIPVIGLVWVLVELGFLAGDYGDNKYGGEDVSSAETVAKWTFWSYFAFTIILFSVGTWVGSRDEPLLGWGSLLYVLHDQYVLQTVWFLPPTVGSLIIWLISRR